MSYAQIKRKKDVTMRQKNELSKEKERIFQEQLLEIKEVIVDSEASVKRSLQVALKTRATGADTLETLEKQTEQIQGIIDKTKNIQKTAEQAEESILHIKTYGLSRFFPPVSDFLKHPFKRKSKEKPPHHSTLAQRINQDLLIPHEPKSKPHYNEPIDRTLLDEEALEMFDKTNEELDELGEIIQDLNQLAREQGEEIDWQNKHLEKLKPKIEKATATIVYETRRAGML